MKILLILATLLGSPMASNPNFGLGIDSLGEQNEQTQNEKRFSKREEAARQAIENADEGDAMSYAALGSMHFSGLRADKSNEKAELFFEKSCELGNGTGCFDLALLNVKEIFGPKDESKIFRLYKKGCELCSEAACNNLGLIYESQNDLKKIHKFICQSVQEI
ncbi:tetratricopeptide repeat protein [uncultured Campylobacter sp.]|uniref:tetratricopeptide repeat protein n=1 Tax=uncultured Campylobacter sp. TaxID=218934 RepID=UPI00261124E6|nr:tetratricopeptide repeat protein [uncultured Campylobacter sp.]